MFEKNLWEQFKTNRYERIATLCLTGSIIIGLITYNYISTYNIRTEKTNPELIKLLEDYYANQQEKEKPSKKIYNKEPQKSWKEQRSTKTKPKVIFSLFEFDPNTAKYNDLIKLSFTSKQANTLLKFRRAGFVFKKTNDLDKVHGLDQNLLSKVKPYVTIIPSSNEHTKSKYPTYRNDSLLDTSKNVTSKKPKLPKIIEINTATHEELMDIYGIGKTYASIIINYRNDLGGYIDLSQIKDQYKFPDSTFHILQKSLTIDTTIRQKIDINKVTFKELLAHPYVTYEQNKILFPFIKNRRPINDLHILKEIMVLDASIIDKLIPYLKME